MPPAPAPPTAPPLPPKTDPVPYSGIRGQLNTGDLFFLFGTSDAGVMIENLENDAGWPAFSHVGMVVKDGDALYLWDAPGSGETFTDPYAASDPDNRAYPHAQHDGCRVSPLDEVLAYYADKAAGGGFWLRQLSVGPAGQPGLAARQQAQFQALRLFINRVDGLPFPEAQAKFLPPKYWELTGLAASFAAGQLKSSVLYGSYFCAQLVADSYMHMGLLRMETFPPNGYSPAAFGLPTPSERLPLVAPATLGTLRFVSWDGPSRQGQAGGAGAAPAPGAS